MDISLVLRKARALLEKGWCQGKFTDHDGHACLVGAVAIISGWNSDLQPFPVHVDTGLARLRLAAWNDKPGRTQSEVLALMDRAISIAAKQEHTKC